MERIFSNTNVDFIRILFFTFLLHLITFEIFTFTIPVEQESFKPHFSYLGSILGNEKLSQSGYRTVGERKDNDNSEIIVSSINKSKPNLDFTSKKPFSKFSDTALKKDIKSTFLQDVKENTVSKDSIKYMGVSETEKPYKPLKLDQNNDSY